MVQKCLGPYFLIPKYFRKNAFSYYKDYNELIDNTVSTYSFFIIHLA